MRVERKDGGISVDGAAAGRNRSGPSRMAIVEAAKRLFLDGGYASVSMDDLAAAAGIARRTLYYQFESKEEIFREVLADASVRLADVFPPGIETRGDVETVLGLIADAVLAYQRDTDYVALMRMVISDGRQFPWLVAEFERVTGPQMERFSRYLAHLADLEVLDCRDPNLAAHQFSGLLNEALFWPRVIGRGERFDDDKVKREAVTMFLLRYRKVRSSSAAP